MTELKLLTVLTYYEDMEHGIQEPRVLFNTSSWKVLRDRLWFVKHPLEQHTSNDKTGCLLRVDMPTNTPGQKQWFEIYETCLRIS